MGRLWSSVVPGVVSGVAAVSLLAGAGVRVQSADVPGATDDEVRGLWVLRTSLTSPQRISELVKIASSGGYNTLLVQVRGRGDAYYQSAIDPRATELDGQPATFDPLRVTLEQAHAAGLKVHAWFNVNLVSSAVFLPRSRDHIVARQPGWLMVPRPLAASLARLDPRTPGYLGQLARWARTESNAVEGLYLSPVPEASQAYTVAVVNDLLRSYALDGLHLDYVRYPTADFDYGQVTVLAFRHAMLPAVALPERERLDRQARTDPEAWPKAFAGPWAAFRRDRLSTLVHRIRATAQEARPGVVLSAAVVPLAGEARDHRLQDWPAWTRAGVLDVVCPMAYTTDVTEFARQIAGVREAAHGVPVWAGIGAWRLPVGRAADHVRAARRADAAGVLLFSYDSLLTSVTPRGSYFTQLRPALLAPPSGDRQ